MDRRKLLVSIGILMFVVSGCMSNSAETATTELHPPTDTPVNTPVDTPVPPPTDTPVPPIPEPIGPPLQMGSDLIQTRLSLPGFDELPDNHIGVHYEDYDRYSDRRHVSDLGFKRLRTTSLTDFWGEGTDALTFKLESIPPEVDQTISYYADHDVIIVLDLWMGADLVPYGTRFQSEQEISQYLDYVRFVVSHFKGRIPYYQIWNEPGDMAVSNYANLVNRVVPVIRETDPDAGIIIGGTQGNWEDGYPGYGKYQRFSVDIDYLTALLNSGVVEQVDGISWHPFYGNIAIDDYYQNYPELVQEIKNLAESQGFSGEYFADELLWATVSEEGWAGGPPHTPKVTAKYYVRAIVQHRGLDLNVTLNTFFQNEWVEPIRDICYVLGGAQPADLGVTVDTDAENVLVYSFSLPDGDKLVAVWTNGGPIEDDPGAAGDLTIADVSASSVSAIDVFGEYEQELIFDQVGGEVIIPDVRIRDYPLILRLSD